MHEFDVFVSYNSRDHTIAEEVADSLRKQHLRVWIDSRKLPPGEKWKDLITQAIHKARSLAVLIGEADLSPGQKFECRAANSDPHTLRVIPVLLPGVPHGPRAMPQGLQVFSCVDARKGLEKKVIYRLRWGITGIEPTAFERFWDEVLAGHDGKSIVPVVFSAKPGEEHKCGMATEAVGYSIQLTYNEVVAFQGLQNQIAHRGLQFRVVHGDVERKKARAREGREFELDQTLMVIGSPHANHVCRRLFSQLSNDFPLRFGPGKHSSACKHITLREPSRSGGSIGKESDFFPDVERLSNGETDLRTDWCLVARITNPFAGTKVHKLLLTAGCHGPGSESAVRFVCDERSIQKLHGKVGSDDFAVLLKAPVHQHRGQLPGVERIIVHQDGGCGTLEESKQ